MERGHLSAGATRLGEKNLLILTVNTGSSSVRLAVFIAAGGRLEPAGAQRYEDGAEPMEILRRFLREHAPPGIALVAHRVVHGGEKLRQPRVLTPEVEAEIENCSRLAPLHNPLALRWVRACRALLPAAVKQVAVFDTAYYAQLPPVARLYALPAELAERRQLRRYGFHGLAHATMYRRWRERQAQAGPGGRVISLQLGAGCSITARDDAGVRDTSMGFSPLEGLVMATRSGDIDPGLIFHLQRQEGWSAEETERLLNEGCGLRGVSGISADMRELLASDEPRARLAVDLYCYRARKYLGAYLAVLGGVDAVLFGGGVGENAPPVRARILAGMEWAGIRLDPAANNVALGTEGCISHAESRAQAWVIAVDEARILAEEALAVTAA